jgi:hypothetical protein
MSLAQFYMPGVKGAGLYSLFETVANEQPLETILFCFLLLLQ